MKARHILDQVMLDACGIKPTPKGHFRKKELALGTDEEGEHTTNKGLATTIAKQHLAKTPDYYTRLRKFVEPRAKKLSMMALPPSSSAPSSP